jgi:hypothetical protein
MNPNPESAGGNPLPIVLLDLNYTLIDNCDDNAAISFPERIATHTYRHWLVRLLVESGLRVFILTARPQRYRVATLEHIQLSTGWQPERYYGNTHGEPPPVAKERMLRERIFPEFGRAGLDELTPFLGLESNPRTRTMYARHNIPSLSCLQLTPTSNLNQVWKSLATGLFATSPLPPHSTGTCASSSHGMTSQPEWSPTSPATT